MLTYTKSPSDKDLDLLLLRPSLQQDLVGTVEDILRTVKNEGDAAIIKYAAKFDGVCLSELKVPPAEFHAVRKLLYVFPLRRMAKCIQQSFT